jgi:hypothetical protein
MAVETKAENISKNTVKGYGKQKRAINQSVRL